MTPTEEERFNTIIADLTELRVNNTILMQRVTDLQNILLGPNMDDGLVTRLNQAVLKLNGICKVIWAIAVPLITAAVMAIVYLIAAHPLSLTGGH